MIVRSPQVRQRRRGAEGGRRSEPTSGCRRKVWDAPVMVGLEHTCGTNLVLGGGGNKEQETCQPPPLEWKRREGV